MSNYKKCIMLDIVGGGGGGVEVVGAGDDGTEGKVTTDNSKVS